MSKHWKSPDEKQWWTCVVDGKPIGCMEESSALDKEKERTHGLRGVWFRKSEDEDLIRFRVHTKIPKRILNRMEVASGKR